MPLPAPTLRTITSPGTTSHVIAYENTNGGNMKTLEKPLIAILFLSVVSAAQTHPNFSGTWKLNVQKSDTASGVTAVTAEVNHKDPTLSYTVKGTQGGQDFEEAETFTTDGKASQDSHGATVKAHWEGPTLVVEGTGSDGSQVFLVRLSLSEDGKTITRMFKQAEDSQPIHQIYEKQ
jgi:hypothetical protein